MNSTTEKDNLNLTDKEIKILDVFRNIPNEKKNEAIIKLYILAENSSEDYKV